MTNILITRPETDAKSFAEALAAHGAQTMIESLSHVAYEQPMTLPLHYDAVIVTSRHALLAPVAHTIAHDVPLFVVGEASTKLAQSLGFTDVHMAGENVNALAEYMQDHVSLDTLLYLRGTHVHHSLIDLLPAFNIEERIVYTTHLTPEFSHECIEALRNHELSGVAFFSTRHAKHFVSLCTQHKLNPYADLTAFCMSAAIAKAIKNHPWRATVVSPSQNAASMVQAVTSN